MTLKNKILALLTAAVLAVSLTGCDFLAADPQNRFFYTADGQYLYVMPNPDSGLMSPLYTMPLPDIQAIAPDPSGRYLYVANTETEHTETGDIYYTQLSWFSVGSNGYIEKVGEFDFPSDMSAEIMDMSVTPSGDSLILNADFGFGVFFLDAKTGVPGIESGFAFSGPQVIRMATHPGGSFVYGNTPGSVVGYSLVDGAQVADQPLMNAASLVVDETGKYLVAFTTGVGPVAARKFGIKSVIGGGGETAMAVWYAINQATGALTELKSVELPITSGLAFSDARGKFVYICDVENGEIRTYRLNATTQSLDETAVTPFNFEQFPADFATLGSSKRAE